MGQQEFYAAGRITAMVAVVHGLGFAGFISSVLRKMHHFGAFMLLELDQGHILATLLTSLSATAKHRVRMNRISKD
ncbi:hypothetical protein [Jeongeupia naejangsanensis]|uniref:Uncharacterized protein n=1 Tax=Jeongeupia naejangsanensis TaxID=613195 RepID=A0ABS2BQ91_9NEIS|nr:hypothetical protein [Jeongeupia naejangsanensis]MBM3117768.1 hypothetical protein [Jeongeupia naejangsanensis]